MLFRSTAENGIKTFKQILILRQEVDKKIASPGRIAENARRLLSHLYMKPSITINVAMDLLGINKNPARRLIGTLQDIGILEEITGHRRNRIFLFKDYLDIFTEKSEL